MNKNFYLLVKILKLIQKFHLNDLIVISFKLSCPTFFLLSPNSSQIGISTVEFLVSDKSIVEILSFSAKSKLML